MLATSFSKGNYTPYHKSKGGVGGGGGVKEPEICQNFMKILILSEYSRVAYRWKENFD